MLTTFHRLSKSWFFKGILLVTALSFMTFFGVGGLDETARMSNAVITVGDTEVQAGKFVDAYNKAMENARKRLGAAVPDERELENQVLAYVLQTEQSKAVASNAAKNLDITVYPEKVANFIRSIPDFQDVEGNFDKSLFSSFLYFTGQSESAFIEDLQQNILENELFAPVANLAYMPSLMAEEDYAKKFETRDVTVYEIPYAKVKVTEKPSQEEIQNYYDSEKEISYMNPEYRSLSVLYLPFEDVFASIPVSDEEVLEVYERDKSLYVKPETRKIDQMRFDSLEEAQKAQAELKNKDFRKVASEMLSQSEDDTYLGDLAKSDVLYEAADDLFAAKKNDIVGPVQSEFGWHLFKVLDITEEKVTNLSDVKQSIISSVQKQKASDVLYDKAAQLDDYLGSGKTFEEAKAQFNLKELIISDIDVTGKDRKGKDVVIPFVADDFLVMAFSLTEGMETPVSEAGDAFYVVRADKITAPEVKPLEEVKEKVIALWESDKIHEKATKTAEDVLKDMQEGKKVKSAKSYKGVVNGAEDSELNGTLSTRIFAMPLNEPEIISDKDGLFVAEVTKITPANPAENKDGVESIKEQGFVELSEEMTMALLNDFAEQYKIEVNQPLLKKLFGERTEAE